MGRGHEPDLALRCRRAVPHRARCHPGGNPLRGARGLRHHGQSRRARIRRASGDPRARRAPRVVGGADRAARFLAGRRRGLGRMVVGRAGPGLVGRARGHVVRRGPPSWEPGARPGIGPGLPRARRRDSRGIGDAHGPGPVGPRRLARAPAGAHDPSRGGRARGPGPRLGAGANRRGSLGARGRPRGVLGEAGLRLRGNPHRGSRGARARTKTAARHGSGPPRSRCSRARAQRAIGAG